MCIFLIISLYEYFYNNIKSVKNFVIEIYLLFLKKKFFIILKLKSIINYFLRIKQINDFFSIVLPNS